MDISQIFSWLLKKEKCRRIVTTSSKKPPSGGGSCAGLCTSSISPTTLRFTWTKLDATGSAWMLPSSPVLQAKGELPGELNASLRKAAAYLPAFAGSLQAAR